MNLSITDLGRLARALISDLRTQTETAPLVVLLERVDRAEPDTARWLEEWFVPELSRLNMKVLLILTRYDDPAKYSTFVYGTRL